MSRVPINLPCNFHPESNIVTVCTVRECSMGNLLCPECIMYQPEHALQHKSSLQLLQTFLQKLPVQANEHRLDEKYIQEKIQEIETQAQNLEEELNVIIEQEFKRVDLLFQTISTKLKESLLLKILSNQNGTLSTIRHELYRLKDYRSPGSPESLSYIDTASPESLKKSIIDLINGNPQEEDLYRSITHIEGTLQTGKAAKGLRSEIFTSVSSLMNDIRGRFPDIFKSQETGVNQREVESIKNTQLFTSLPGKISGSTNDSYPRMQEYLKIGDFPPEEREHSKQYARVATSSTINHVAETIPILYGDRVYEDAVELKSEGEKITEKEAFTMLGSRMSPKNESARILSGNKKTRTLYAKINGILCVHPRYNMIKGVIEDFIDTHSLFEVSSNKYFIGTEESLKNGGLSMIIDGAGNVYFGEHDSLEFARNGILWTGEGEIYEGMWVNGKLEGFGKFESGDGETAYEGGFSGGLRHGEGVETRADGTVYEGCFEKGMKHRKGTYKWANGESYEGEFFENKIEGVGTYRWQDGTLYKGEWKNSMMDGKGLLIEQHGGRYLGDFRRDLKHGYGIYQWSDGWSYRGDWVEGYQHGIGVEIDPNKEQRVGEWERGTLVKWFM